MLGCCWVPDARPRLASAPHGAEKPCAAQLGTPEGDVANPHDQCLLRRCTPALPAVPAAQKHRMDLEEMLQYASHELEPEVRLPCWHRSAAALQHLPAGVACWWGGAQRDRVDRLLSPDCEPCNVLLRLPHPLAARSLPAALQEGPSPALQLAMRQLRDRCSLQFSAACLGAASKQRGGAAGSVDCRQLRVATPPAG